jgi:hypothetical protein
VSRGSLQFGFGFIAACWHATRQPQRERGRQNNILTDRNRQKQQSLMLVYIAGLLSAIHHRQTETTRPSRTLHSRLAFCIDRKQVYSKYGKHCNYTAVWLSCINYRQTETARPE